MSAPPPSGPPGSPGPPVPPANLTTALSSQELQWSDLSDVDLEVPGGSLLGMDSDALEQMTQGIARATADENVSSDGEFTRIADREANRLTQGGAASDLLATISEVKEVKMEDNNQQALFTIDSQQLVQMQGDGQQRMYIPVQNQQQMFDMQSVCSPPEIEYEMIPSIPAALTPDSKDFQSIFKSNGATSPAPSVNDYPGEWNFEATLPSGGKSKDPHYCKELSKLFIDQNSNVTVQFTIKPPAAFLASSSGKLPPGLFIRAVMVFTRHDDFPSVVATCPQHSLLEGGHLKSHCAQHIVRNSPENMGIYLMDKNSGRFCVLTRVPELQPGTDTIPISYRFMDLNSCVGGINRRDTAVIFTLEYSGEIIGRKVHNVRVCTCLKRDMKNELELKRKNASVTDATAGLVNGGGRDGGSAAAGKGKVVMTDKDKRKPMWVLTYGERDYQTLKGVAERFVVAQGGDVGKWHEQMRIMNNRKAIKRVKSEKDGQQQQGQLRRSGSDTDTAPEMGGSQESPVKKRKM